MAQEIMQAARMPIRPAARGEPQRRRLSLSEALRWAYSRQMVDVVTGKRLSEGESDERHRAAWREFHLHHLGQLQDHDAAFLAGLLRRGQRRAEPGMAWG